MRYFDTTVLSRRVFGDEAERLAAAETVAEDTAITSKYVFQEYLLTFMDAAIWLHKLLVDSPSKKEALARFHKIRPPDSRKIRAHQVCVAVMDEWGESREELIDRLEVWIEHFILDYFWEGIACCMNETNCRRCAPVPKREGNRFSLTCQCAAHNPQGCGIEAFWNEREQALQKLKNSAEKLPKQRTVCTDAAKVLDEGASPAGLRCGRLSDAVIALAAPEDAVICSTDKHFVNLCEVLGRQLLNPLKHVYEQDD